MDKAQRQRTHVNIFIKVAGSLFLPPDPEILPLGADYKIKMQRLIEKKNILFEGLRKELRHLSSDQIIQFFDHEGAPLSDEGRDILQRHSKAVDSAFGRLKSWYKAPLFRTKSLADYDYWAKSEFLSIDEVVWLSIGFEPTSKLIEAFRIASSSSRGDPQEDPIAVYIARHKELIRRRFDPYNHGDKPDLLRLYDWILKTSLDVHPEFLRLLAAKAKPTSEQPMLSQVGSQAGAHDQNIDNRERASLSTLLAAMAIDAYGYDPAARRSGIPNEIQGIADRLGLNISSNTIRKYLKQGAEQLPENWKPE